MENTTQFYMVENPGLLEPIEIYKQGVTNKDPEDENIGQFGTGLAAGIPTFERGGLKVRIFIGETEVPMDYKEFVHKGKTYLDWYVDGINTNTTTAALQLTWNVKNGVREVVANAKDETMSFKGLVDTIEGREGHTRVFMEYGEPVRDYFINYNDNMSEEKTILFEHFGDKVYLKHSNRFCIYKKTVRVNDRKHLNHTSVFDYELNNLELTDDRINQSIYDQIREIWKMLPLVEDKIFINKLIDGLNDTHWPFEWAKIQYANSYGMKFSQAWAEACEQYTLIPNKLKKIVDQLAYRNILIVPDKFYDRITNQYPELSFANKGENGETVDGYAFVKRDFTSNQSDVVLDLKSELKQRGYHCDVPMHAASFDDNDTVASVFNHKEILFTDEFFKQSKESQRKIFFRQICHIDMKAEGRTSSLANYMTDQWYKFAFEAEIV